MLGTIFSTTVAVPATWRQAREVFTYTVLVVLTSPIFTSE